MTFHSSFFLLFIYFSYFILFFRARERCLPAHPYIMQGRAFFFFFFQALPNCSIHDPVRPSSLTEPQAQNFPAPSTNDQATRRKKKYMPVRAHKLLQLTIFYIVLPCQCLIQPFQVDLSVSYRMVSRAICH